jgi:alanine racemase
MTETVSLKKNGAPTRLTVDLAAIAANYRLLCEKSAPAHCAAVVKADAYGLGLAPVVKALAEAGCRRFFVATLDEGIALRALTDAEIFIFNGIAAGDAAEFVAHRLVPVLNDLGQIEIWRGIAEDAPSPPAAIHIDTGMNRLGLDTAAFTRIAQEPGLLNGLTLALVMSHLACGDESAHRKNLEQRQRFAEALPIFGTVPASLSASYGIFLGPEWLFDWTRPGIALYGGNPTPGSANPMAPVVRLAARILQCRDIAAGETVGYGAIYKAEKPRRIATVGIGYADGYFRHLGGQGRVFVGKRAAPVVGRVSMDLIGVDITGLDGVKAGDWVDIIGPCYGVDDLAGEAGTIEYEVLTALGQRHRRDYVGAGA